MKPPDAGGTASVDHAAWPVHVVLSLRNPDIIGLVRGILPCPSSTLESVFQERRAQELLALFAKTATGELDKTDCFYSRYTYVLVTHIAMAPSFIAPSFIAPSFIANVVLFWQALQPRSFNILFSLTPDYTDVFSYLASHCCWPSIHWSRLRKVVHAGWKRLPWIAKLEASRGGGGGSGAEFSP